MTAARNGFTNTNQAPERSDIAPQIVLAVLIDCVGHKQAQRSHNGTDEKQDDDDCWKHWISKPHFLVATPITTGCCHVDNPSQDDWLWRLHGPISCAEEARRASSVRQQQLRTDLTLRLSERCVEGLSLCGRSGVERRVNQCSAGAGHAPNDSPAGQMNVSTPIATSVRSQRR